MLRKDKLGPGAWLGMAAVFALSAAAGVEVEERIRQMDELSYPPGVAARYTEPTIERYVNEREALARAIAEQRRVQQAAVEVRSEAPRS